MIDQDNKWLEKVRDELNNSVQDIDAATQSKLTYIRNRALKNTSNNIARFYRFPAAVLVTACLVLAIIFNFPKEQTDQNGMINDLDLITTSESLELIEDLEFYEWLEAYDIPT